MHLNRTMTTAAAVAILLGACGGASKPADANGSTPPATGVLEVAGPRPSASATMVCANEARGDIASSIGLDAVRVSKPTWREAEHLLSCTYEYAAGARMTLSVKELSSPDETTSYFDALGHSLGRVQSFEIAQGAFRTSNGSLVVRKDYKVLLIDVSRLPAQFGAPATARDGCRQCGHGHHGVLERRLVHGPEVMAIVAWVQYAPAIVSAGTISFKISGATS